MPREIEKAAASVLTKICGPSLTTPAWLVRPGQIECRDRWQLIREIYHRLTGLDLPDVMRRVERRTVDGVFNYRKRTFVFELDEIQHFNVFRATTLLSYPSDAPLAFSKELWLERCSRKTRLEGGGFAKPKPPLFPGENGRHKQRAFRDALCDLVPPEHGYLPTLRLGDFEVVNQAHAVNAKEQITRLLDQRLAKWAT